MSVIFHSGWWGEGGGERKKRRKVKKEKKYEREGGRGEGNTVAMGFYMNINIFPLIFFSPLLHSSGLPTDFPEP